MTFGIQDLRKLQLPLITFGVALIFATLVYSATDARKTQAEHRLDAQKTALMQAQQRYQSSGQEKDNIIKYLPEYQKLIARGFVGEEQRVDWIDDLRKVNLRHKLFAISYDIATQEDYKPGFPLNAGKFKPHRSVMKISFPMLHEGDLLTLLQELPNETNPPHLVRDCVIERRPGGARGKFLPNLNADCVLDWITVSEPSYSGGRS